MMKMVELKQYNGIPVENPYTIIHVNPRNIDYIYSVSNAGKDMTVIVFVGDTKICVLGNKEEIKKVLEES